MAKNTGRGTRNAVTAERESAQRDNDNDNGLWVRRNLATGRFTEAKRTGGAFKGSRRSS